MAQRGGGVQSHLRFADGEVHRDLIPVGEADLLIAVEPLECLRYMQYLKDGRRCRRQHQRLRQHRQLPARSRRCSSALSALPRHVLIDAERIARAAGSGRAANIVILGAALAVPGSRVGRARGRGRRDVRSARAPQVVEANQRAFRFGRNAAQAYLDGLGRGGRSVAVRHWIDTLDAEHLAAPEPPDAPVFEVVACRGPAVGRRGARGRAHAGAGLRGRPAAALRARGLLDRAARRRDLAAAARLPLDGRA